MPGADLLRERALRWRLVSPFDAKAEGTEEKRSSQTDCSTARFPVPAECAGREDYHCRDGPIRTDREDPVQRFQQRDSDKVRISGTTA